jgi:hypothetical protein
MKSEDLLKKACLKLGVSYVPPVAGASEKEVQDRIQSLRRSIADERGKALCTAKLGERLKKKKLVRQMIRNKIAMPQVLNNDLQQRASLLVAAPPPAPHYGQYGNYAMPMPMPMQPYQINRLHFLSSMNTGAVPSSSADYKSLYSTDTPSHWNQDSRKRAAPLPSSMANSESTLQIGGYDRRSLSYLTNSTDPNEHAGLSLLGSILSTRSPLDVARAASAGELLRSSPPIPYTTESYSFENHAERSRGAQPPKKRHRSLPGKEISSQFRDQKGSNRPSASNSE